MRLNGRRLSVGAFFLRAKRPFDEPTHHHSSRWQIRLNATCIIQAPKERLIDAHLEEPTLHGVLLTKMKRAPPGAIAGGALLHQRDVGVTPT